jgi:omega-hydroxy-beta-dihydromenaquinone-9 sulfotransferase
MDNMRTGWLSPEEDNIALSILAGVGPRLFQVFPRNEKYRPASDPTQKMSRRQRALFSEAISSFSKKLVFLHRARPLFKSPIHTRHVAEIPEIFPDAKFLTIFRNPFFQFASFKAMHHSAGKDWSALQKRRPLSDDDRLTLIDSILQSYMETRSLTPRGQLCEIQYSELVQQKQQCINKICTTLDLGTPPDPTIQTAKVAYKRNSHPPLDPELSSKNRLVYKPYVDAILFTDEEV